MSTPTEPQLRFNGKWSVGVFQLLQLAVMIFGIGGAWFSVTGKQEETLRRVEELRVNVEQQRTERILDVKEIQQKISNILVESAARGVEVSNLNLLMGDLRRTIDSMRKGTKGG